MQWGHPQSGAKTSAFSIFVPRSRKPSCTLVEGSPRSGGRECVLLCEQTGQPLRGKETLLRGAGPIPFLAPHVASESPFQVNSLGWESRRAGHLLRRAPLRPLPLPAGRQACLPGAPQGRPPPEWPGRVVEGAAGPGPEWERQGPEPRSVTDDRTHRLEGTETRRGARPRALRQARDARPPPPVALRRWRPTAPVPGTRGSGSSPVDSPCSRGASPPEAGTHSAAGRRSRPRWPRHRPRSPCRRRRRAADGREPAGLPRPRSAPPMEAWPPRRWAWPTAGNSGRVPLCTVLEVGLNLKLLLRFKGEEKLTPGKSVLPSSTRKDQRVPRKRHPRRPPLYTYTLPCEGPLPKTLQTPKSHQSRTQAHKYLGVTILLQAKGLGHKFLPSTSEAPGFLSGLQY